MMSMIIFFSTTDFGIAIMELRAEAQKVNSQPGKLTEMEERKIRTQHIYLWGYIQDGLGKLKTMSEKDLFRLLTILPQIVIRTIFPSFRENVMSLSSSHINFLIVGVILIDLFYYLYRVYAYEDPTIAYVGIVLGSLSLTLFHCLNSVLSLWLIKCWICMIFQGANEQISFYFIARVIIWAALLCIWIIPSVHVVYFFPPRSIFQINMVLSGAVFKMLMFPFTALNIYILCYYLLITIRNEYGGSRKQGYLQRM